MPLMTRIGSVVISTRSIALLTLDNKKEYIVHKSCDQNLLLCLMSDPERAISVIGPSSDSSFTVDAKAAGYLSCG